MPGINDRAREFWETAAAQSGSFVGRHELPTIMSEFAALEREAAAKQERAKIAGEVVAIVGKMQPDDDVFKQLWAYIEKLRGKEIG